MPLFSIVIVNYNSFPILKECIKSINQYYSASDCEIIIVDNCSTEGDVEQFLEPQENLKLFKLKTNIGYGAANNYGIIRASGEYILILNNDMIFLEDCVTPLINFCNSSEKKVLISPKLLNEDKSYQITTVDFDTISNLIGEYFFLYKIFPRSAVWNKYHMNYKFTSAPIQVDVIKGAFIFGEKKVFESLQGFDERFYFYNEENDLCYRHKSKGGEVVLHPGVAIIHLGGKSTESSHWFKVLHMHITKIQYFQKHFSFMKALLAVLIHYFGYTLRVFLYALSGLVKLNTKELERASLYLRVLYYYPKNQFKDK